MLAWALTLQSLELLRLWPRLRPLWPWDILRADLPAWLGPSLNDDNFPTLLAIRLLASLTLFQGSPPALVWLLLLTTVLTSLRFRGTLNGGSDTMTVVALSSLLVPWGGVYLAVQLTLSYFVAGLAKLRQPLWRNGTALRRLTGLPGWLAPPLLLWECTFPLAWTHPWVCAFYLASGACFHLANCRLLGLNRFLWIWLAAYPALWTAVSG